MEAGRTVLAGRASATGQGPVTGADDLAAIVFTSGSTGTPKGVEYHHGAFAAQVETIRTTYDMRPGEVDLPTFPLFALFDPAIGMTTVVPDMDPTRPAHVDPRRIIEAVEDFGVTNMFGSPALLNRVGRYGVEHGVRLPSLKRVISAGAPVPAQVIERFLELLDDDALVHTPYGATEALPVATASSLEVLGETRAATEAGKGVCVGRPVGTVDVEVIRISDDAIPTWDPSLRVGVGEIGEIVVRGPAVTRAYYRAPSATALAKIRDADGGIRHRMGDLGYLDEQGRLWFCGRKTHRVVTPGGTLFTVPCESVFNTHPEVYRTALVGADTASGRIPVLVVELEAEAAARGASRRTRLVDELLELGAAHDHTRLIRTVLFHPSFPVDIRHNTKIGREQLGRWATRRLR
jgi:acyl-CoA synthetase (AMP-forming)/AMP-acid ligase II